MATIQGVFVDQNTKKPIGGVVMDAWPTGDMSGTPITSFQANDDGTFDITSSYLDAAGAVLDVNFPGYYELTGNPSVFTGNVELIPTEVTKVMSKIPWWAWVVISLIAAFIAYNYFYKGKKLV